MMATWDGTKFIHWPPERYPDNPDWWRLDCVCGAGMKMVGETPEDCTACGGRAHIAYHNPTGTIAMYPGGPLMGSRREPGRFDHE